MSAAAIRAGAAYIELTLRDGVSRPLHAASLALKDFGNNVAWQGAKIAAMGAAVTAPLAAMAHSFATSAMESGRFASRRDAANVSAYVSAVTALGNAMTNLKNALGSAVLPLMTRWPMALARIINQAAAWVRANRAIIQTVARVASTVALAGTVMVVLGKGIAMVGTALGVLSTVAATAATGVAFIGSVLAAILSPLGLVITGVIALAGYLLYASGVGEQAMAWLGQAFSGFQADAMQAIQGVIDALMAGDVKTAAEVFWTFVKLEWQKGINVINQLWINAKDFFLKVWSDASFNAAGYFIDAWAMVENGWVETVDFLADTWEIFTNIFTKTWHSAIGFIKKAWVNLKALFDKDINVNAEVTRINAETDAQWKAADDKQNATIGARNESRKNRKAEIERNRRESQANLGQQQVAEDRGREKEFEQQRQRSQAAVDTARKDFNDSTDKAKKSRAMVKPERMEFLGPMRDERSKLESKGTFSAVAARGLGAGNLADRTAKASEKSADLLKKVEENTRKAGIILL